MRIPILFFSIIITLQGFTQHNDTVWWVKPSSIRYIINTDENFYTIRCWHPNGMLMAAGKFKLKNAYIPASDIVIVDSTNRKVQQYISSTGTLINYFNDGTVKDSLHATLRDTSQQFIEYYTNGYVKKQWLARKDTGMNGIVFYPYSNNEPRMAFMYQQSTFGYHHYSEFYPSGNIYKTTTIDPVVYYKHTWYTPEGEIDQSSYMGRGSSNYPSLKEGLRLEWWNNGNLKSENHYKKDYEEGVQRSWHENGQLQLERFVNDGSPDSITRIFYPDGSLKYYVDCRFKIENKPSISFHANGVAERQDMAITTNYDEQGNLWFEYFSSGNYSRSFDFRNGNPNLNHYEGRFDKMRIGKWKAYDDKGRLMYETFYENGLTEGETKIYDSLGHLRSSIHYHEGRMDGAYLLLNENGKDTLAYGFHNSGRRWGLWRQFFQNGQLESVVRYGDKTYDELLKYNDKGELLMETVYYPVDKIEIRRQFQDQKLSTSSIKYIDKNVSDTYEYFPNGKTRRTIIYQKNGSYIEKSWFENGQQEMIVQRKDNKAFGRFIMWWPNGNKRYEGMMNNGVRDGKWKFFNEDGSIASEPYFENGVEIVPKPKDASCYCYKTYPPLPNRFMNSTETYMPLKNINRIMQRFQLDEGYNAAFVGLSLYNSATIYAYKDVRLNVGTDGMYLNLTPCRQGHNYAVLDISTRYEYIWDESGRPGDIFFEPPTFSEAVERTISILDSWHEPFLFSAALEDVSSDANLFQRFLEVNYGLHFNTKINTGELEQEALSKAGESYEQKHPGDSISFEKDLARHLSQLLLKFYPEQATILKAKPFDREAINYILENFFNTDMYRLGPLLYGALTASIDSGSVAVIFPTKLVSSFDPVKRKSVLKNGKPVPASFLVSFKQARYESYPEDGLIIDRQFIYDECVQEFAIGNSGAWMRPLDFMLHFNSEDDYDNKPDPFQYPFHYEKPSTKIAAGPSEIKTDNYVKNFMGVFIKSGQLFLPGISSQIVAYDVLLDGREMNGYVSLNNQEFTIPWKQMEQAFINAGFKVMTGTDESGEVTMLYFNYQ